LPPAGQQLIFYSYTVAANDPDDLRDEGTAYSYDPTNGFNYIAMAQGGVLVLRPCIMATIACTGGVGTNGPISFNGSVTNCGPFNNFDVPGMVNPGNGTNGLNYLQNVMVYHVADGVTNAILGPISLFAGQGTNFSGSYVPANPCNLNTDMVIAVGTDRCGLTVTNTATSTCTLCQPVIRIVGAAGGMLTLAWDASPGQMFRLQHDSTLNPNNWMNLGGIITASSGTVFTSTAMAPDPQGFYRVIRLQ
jgi:hypothetical protein